MEESISVFQWVADLSPLWWVAFGIALGAIEMATFSFFLIWPALAALVMAGVVGLGPSMSGEALVTIWAILSIVFTFVGRALMNRFGDGGGTPEATLNSRAERLIGRRAKVLAWDGSEGTVEIDGTRWRAVTQFGSALIAETQVEVLSAEGLVLTVGDDTRR